MGASSHKMSQSKPPVYVQSKETATSSLIFLHGLGDQGDGWASQFREFHFKSIRCICPNAPIGSVSLNHGMPMPSWFDIKGLDPSSPEDEQGIKSASKMLKELIDAEIKKGISPEKIVIGGFSQGGAVALYTAFGTDVKIGGVVALSTWIPHNKYFMDQSTRKYNTNVPVIQCHGKSDPLVKLKWGQTTHDLIKTFSPNAQMKLYDNLGHSSHPSEMQDVKMFLQDLLKDS